MKPQPIAHRDLKVDNILVTKIETKSVPYQNGSIDKVTVKLCDFGTSRTAGSQSLMMQVCVIRSQSYGKVQSSCLHSIFTNDLIQNSVINDLDGLISLHIWLQNTV